MRNPLKEMRVERGLSMAAFAHILGVNEPALRKAESGQVAMPSRLLGAAARLLSKEQWQDLQQNWLDYQAYLEQRRLKEAATPHHPPRRRLTLSPEELKAWPCSMPMPRNSLNPFYKHRARRSMTLGQYANLLDVSRGSLSLAEREGVQFPESLMRALCDLEDLNFDQVAEEYRRCRQHRREDAFSLMQDGGV